MRLLLWIVFAVCLEYAVVHSKGFINNLKHMRDHTLLFHPIIAHGLYKRGKHMYKREGISFVDFLVTRPTLIIRRGNETLLR